MTTSRKKPTRRGTATKRANNQISLTVNQIKHGLQSTKQARNDTITHARTDYRNGRDDINDIYNAVANQLASSQGKIDTGYANTQAQVSAANNALVAQLAQTSAANQAAAQAEQARLGIQQSGMSSFGADAANSMSVAQQSNNDAMANLQLSHTNADSIGELLKGMNSGQRLSSIGKLTNSRNDALSQAREAFNQQRIASQNAITEAKDAREERIQQILAQMPRPVSRRPLYYSGGSSYHPYSSHSSGGYSSGYSGGYSGGGGSSQYSNNVDDMFTLLQKAGYPKGHAPRPKPKPVKHKSKQAVVNDLIKAITSPFKGF